MPTLYTLSDKYIFHFNNNISEILRIKAIIVIAELQHMESSI